MKSFVASLAFVILPLAVQSAEVSDISCRQLNGAATVEFAASSNTMTVKNLNGVDYSYSVQIGSTSKDNSIDISGVDAAGDWAQLTVSGEGQNGNSVIKGRFGNVNLVCQAK